MNLEMKMNRRISSSGSYSSGAFGTSASSASAQPLPFYLGNSAVNSYGGIKLVLKWK